MRAGIGDAEGLVFMDPELVVGEAVDALDIEALEEGTGGVFLGGGVVETVRDDLADPDGFLR